VIENDHVGQGPGNRLQRLGAGRHPDQLVGLQGVFVKLDLQVVILDDQNSRGRLHIQPTLASGTRAKQDAGHGNVGHRRQEPIRSLSPKTVATAAGAFEYRHPAFNPAPFGGLSYVPMRIIPLSAT
jgi:hypothetical protein